MNPAAVYDLETQGWTTFVVGAVHYRDGRTAVYRHDRARELADDLLAVEGEVWAHNGGRFDHLWLLDQHPDREATVQSNASGIISLQFEGSPAVFLDSLRVFPFNLRTLTNGAKQDLSDLCTCDRALKPKGCGGYCAIRIDMPPHVRKRVEEYLTADVVELMRALLYFGGRAEEWGIDIRRTLGATAWASAEAELGIERVEWTRALWREVRDAYQGGRAEVFRRWSDRGQLHDVNSMYPWALTQPLPVGVPVVKEGPAAGRAWASGKPGVFRATVDVPETWIPPLPVRTTAGIAFPYGRLAGHWARPELEHALASGCTLHRVHSAVTWQGEAALFGPWIERIYRLRREHGKDTREGKWLKWIANSLTGKLGTRAESRRLKINPDLRALPLCRCTLDLPCSCGGYRPLDETGRVWEQRIETKKVEPCAHPEWAAYLTARARVKLHRALTDGDGAVYSDTDSRWSESPLTAGAGEALGEWQPQGEYREFEALGPKAYRALVKGKETVALKGIPSPEWTTVKQGVPQEFESMAGVRRPDKKTGRFFVRLPQKRKVTPNTGNRVVHAASDPRTYPVHVGSLP